MTTYLASTFSPMMLSSDVRETSIREIPLSSVPAVESMRSIVSHENTAAVLSMMLCEPVAFSRVNVELAPGDMLYCVVPYFRATEAREFTFDEVMSAGFRCFVVGCSGNPTR
ncbi:MAG: DUF1874 domain-containing protein [Desulfobacterales bacterium]|nr:DUF1874 domain-containing protein [Desulfobacterales bacterium]